MDNYYHQPHHNTLMPSTDKRSRVKNCVIDLRTISAYEMIILYHRLSISPVASLLKVCACEKGMVVMVGELFHPHTFRKGCRWHRIFLSTFWNFGSHASIAIYSSSSNFHRFVKSLISPSQVSEWILAPPLLLSTTSIKTNKRLHSIPASPPNF